jgi:hypothetical protein
MTKALPSVQENRAMAIRVYLTSVIFFAALVWAGAHADPPTGKRGGGGGAKADDATPTQALPHKGGGELEAKVKKLVDQLNDKDFAKREAAKTELIKLGPDILPFLPQSDAKLSPEQINRLTAIRTTLREAVAEKVLTPRLVTLQRDNIPLSLALAELTKQTGTLLEDLRTDKTADPTVKLRLEKVTFWQAVDALAREADLRVVFDHKEGKVALADGPNRTPPGSLSYSGLFRIAVKRIQADQDLESDKEGHFCTVYLEVAWEPRFHPLFLESQPATFEIKDDKGNVLKALEQGGGRVPLSERIASQLQVRLEAPKRTALNLGQLKGSLNVLGPAKMVQFTFDKLAEKPAPSQVQDGVKLTLLEFDEGEKGEELWKVTLKVEYAEGGPEFESFEQWLINNEAYLEKKDGKKRIKTGNSETEPGARQAILRYFFSDEGIGKPENWKLVYRTPGQILKVPVNFEFKELPLP